MRQRRGLKGSPRGDASRSLNLDSIGYAPQTGTQYDSCPGDQLCLPADDVDRVLDQMAGMGSFHGHAFGLWIARGLACRSGIRGSSHQFDSGL